ncbi:MAG: hypothetical protein GXP46_01690 [Deferribacteres bacterium]|nr:hypothetical protein [Deferribacteres bacterium]
MTSYDALNKAIGGKTREHAKALGLSTALLYKWQEPSTDWTDSGSYNPLDRIETIIETALKLGQGRNDAFAPLHYLARRFNQILIPAPSSATCLKELQQALMKTIKEFSDLARASAAALEDGRLDPREAEQIKKEGWELIEQASAFVKLIEDYL